jgi:MinD superfamily P-loop ATPase
MKEIVIVSGKGGTGKTSVSASLATLAQSVVVADCDVDAADLHLLLQPEHQSEQVFESGSLAMVDERNCSGCASCAEVCRFGAIVMSSDTGEAVIDPLGCEGCGACIDVCPTNCISLHAQRCGVWYQSITRLGPMVHARLDIGAENSGKLVSLVRRQARELAEATNKDWLIVDGPPGTGCAVIASISNADRLVVVTEASVSGLHDVRRLAELASHFGLVPELVLNKWDLNPGLSAEIEQVAVSYGGRVLGRIAYDLSVNAAQVAGRTLMEAASQEVQSALRQIWHNLVHETTTEGVNNG